MTKPGIFVCWFGLTIVAYCSATGFAADGSPQQIEFFESRIRPVLVERCYACHNSTDEAEGGLAIDWRVGIVDADVIVPGKPKESRLIAILRHEIDGLEMPEDGPRLDDQKIADFEKWIAMGAPDPRDQPPSPEELARVTSWEATFDRRKQWWSFQPIVAAQPPADTSWSNHPIDRFIAETQKENGLAPTDRASDGVLIRRLYFNLIGLPPSPDEVNQWTSRLQENRDEAYGELVDSLLDSPRFGERWARHWMDWIRYAESHGSEGDPRIDNAWHYRDYLIRALNEDVPYDQLVREHVAGDLLDDPRINQNLGLNESVIGPAHWRMVFHGFAPTDALDEKVRFVDDQVNAFSKAFLGLTVSCARCHDHKFDAISQKDYYALFGILASCRPARVVIDLPEKQNRNIDSLAGLKPKIRTAIATDWLGGIEALSERLANVGGKKSEQPDRLLNSLHIIHDEVAGGRSVADAWQAREQAYRDENKASHIFAELSATRRWNLADGNDREAWFATGTGMQVNSHAAGDFALCAAGENALIGIYPAGVYSHGLSDKHSARLTSPDVPLDADSELWMQVIGDGSAMARYVVQDYPRSGTVYPVKNLKRRWEWQKYDLTYWTGDSIHLELATAKDAPLLVKGDERSWFGIRSAVIVPKGSPGPGTDCEFLDPLFGDALPAPPPENPQELGDRVASVIKAAVIAWRDGKITDAQARMLDRCVDERLLPNSISGLPAAKPLIQQYRKLESEITTPTRIPGLDETADRQQPLYVRGNHKLPGEITPRRFLEAIDATPYKSQQSGRRELAEDLLRDDNPLTRRVIVNRIWHHLFGRGIVGTPDNFGRLGMLPTHPALLDYLATKLVRDEWSLKKTIRSILLSKTWQQSSIGNQQSLAKDPDNLFLTRANVRRLEAEAIRDSMLQLSGRLDENAFGPPADGNSNRRSVYVQVIRNRLDPFLRAFDFPEPFSSAGRRDVTNVPAQSLMLMNDAAVSRRAREWVESVLGSDHQTDDERLQSMFLAAFGRKATVDELSRAKTYLKKTREDSLLRRAKFQRFQEHLEHHRRQIAAIKEPVRTRLIEQLKKESGDANPGPAPIARWDFAGDLKDGIGSLDGQLKSGANVVDNELMVNSGGYVVTAPLTKTVKAKTLEAWVRLDTLKQGGGGAMTVQTPNGIVFDSIVFAERKPGQWLAGSNGFTRTQDFDGPEEVEATDRAVHVAIAYHEDGTITGYRDGKPYGRPYKSNGPIEFKAGQAIVSFGVRHLPAGGNRMLAGSINKAQLYDRALSAAEVYSSATSSPYVDDTQVQAAIDESGRKQIKGHERQLEAIRQQIEQLGPIPKAIDEREVWTDLARAMFTFKEFIYIR